MAYSSKITVMGAETRDNTVAAEVLIKAVSAVQKSILLVAASLEEGSIQERFKPSQDLKRRYTLRLAVPEPGSFELPISLADERQQVAIDGAARPDLLRKFGEAWDSIASGDAQKLGDLIKDYSYRVRLLNEFLRMLPKRGDRWSVGLKVERKPQVFLRSIHRPTIEKWLALPPEKQEMSVVGELRTIDFANNRLSIRYQPTGKEIECSYLAEVEDGILEARRGLFQITGQFVLDRDGSPKELTDVRSIEPVDLSEIVLDEADIDDEMVVTIDPPLAIQPRLDESQQMFEGEVEELCFFLSGQTRDALVDDAIGHVRFIWREYAQADDSELSKTGLALKRKTLKRFTVGG